MIRRKLVRSLVPSSLVLLVLLAHPASAAAVGHRGESDLGIWAEVRALFSGLLQTVRGDGTEIGGPFSIFQNAGANLDPDGVPAAAPPSSLTTGHQPGSN